MPNSQCEADLLLSGVSRCGPLEAQSPIISTERKTGWTAEEEREARCELKVRLFPLQRARSVTRAEFSRKLLVAACTGLGTWMAREDFVEKKLAPSLRPSSSIAEEKLRRTKELNSLRICAAAPSRSERSST